MGRSDLLFGMLNRGRFEWAHKIGRVAIGQPQLRIKDARHIAAINWRRAGEDIDSIREWLGHATIAQTIIYNRFAPDDDYDRPAIDRVGERLLGNGEVVRLVKAG